MLRIVVLLMIGLWACQTKRPQIDRAIFVNVLADLYLAEAMVSNQDSTIQGQKNLYKSYQKDIFNKYQITYEEYKSAYDLYNKDLKGMQQLYDEAIGKVSKQQATGIK
jgi:hypothetical protein